MKILICPLSSIESVVAEHRPSHMITLLDPEHHIPTPAGVAPERHLRLGLWDIVHPQPGMAPCSPDTVSEILAFGEGWTGERPLLVHCWAGISRSTATAFMLACARNPVGREPEIARRLRAAAPHASPNRRLVQLADDALARNGRMVEAVEAMGQSDSSVIGRPVELPVF